MTSDLAWTYHVEERLRQRGISRNEAWETIRYPEKNIRLAANKWKFFKTFGSKEVVIVAALVDGQYVIVTSWAKDGSGTSRRTTSRMSGADQLIWSLLTWIGSGIKRIYGSIWNGLTGH